MQSGRSFFAELWRVSSRATQLLSTNRRDENQTRPLRCGIGLLCAGLSLEPKILGLQELYIHRDYITHLREDKFLNYYHSLPPTRTENTTFKLVCIIKDRVPLQEPLIISIAQLLLPLCLKETDFFSLRLMTHRFLPNLLCPMLKSKENPIFE